MHVDIELHNTDGHRVSEAKRGERGAPPYTDMSTNVNVVMELHNTHGCRASRAKRGERGAPHFTQT